MCFKHFLNIFCLFKQVSLTIIFLVLSFNLTLIDLQAQSNENIDESLPIKIKPHDFRLIVNPEDSSLNYTASQLEMQTGIISLKEPHITVKGTLIVEKFESAVVCFVKLPDNVVARDKHGNKISLILEGNIGGKELSTKEFVHPEFENSNEVNFEIIGFIDPKSFKKSPKPGSYNFKDSLSLIIEFHG